jgi:hypothetical protein
MSSSRRAYRVLLLGLASLFMTGGILFLRWSWSDVQTATLAPVVELRVNHQRAASLNQGAPIRFDVNLVAIGSDGMSVGGRWAPWYQRVHLELEDGDTLPWELTHAGSASSGRFFRNARGELDARVETRSVARLHTSSFHSVSFEAAPQATTAVMPNRYRVRAVLEIPAWIFWSWRGRVTSAPVVVDIRRDDPALRSGYLATAAAYYLRRLRFSEARPLVDELVRRTPDRSEPYVLLGQILEGLDDRQGAIDAYARALELVSRRTRYEEPVDLIDRIGRLAVGSR